MTFRTALLTAILIAPAALMQAPAHAKPLDQAPQADMAPAETAPAQMAPAQMAPAQTAPAQPAPAPLPRVDNEPASRPELTGPVARQPRPYAAPYQQQPVPYAAPYGQPQPAPYAAPYGQQAPVASLVGTWVASGQGQQGAYQAVAVFTPDGRWGYEYTAAQGNGAPGMARCIGHYALQGQMLQVMPVQCQVRQADGSWMATQAVPASSSMLQWQGRDAVMVDGDVYRRQA